MEKLIPIIIVALAVAFVAFWQRWIAGNFDFQCAKCGEVFSLPAWQAMIAPHAMGRKLVKCPNCGEMTWATLVHKGNGT
jgi:predicted RNA-binding Zn-ribbon protein involved in translation (DUF1610 family)